jgi:hypothetical protein
MKRYATGIINILEKMIGYARSYKDMICGSDTEPGIEKTGESKYNKRVWG